MSKSNFSEELKRDAVRQVTERGGQFGSRARKPIFDPIEVRRLVVSVEDKRCEMSLTFDGMDPISP